MKCFTIFSLVLLHHTTCFSQNIIMNKEVSEIIASGKDTIVLSALQLVGKEAGTENFSKIRVTTNGKEVFVSFNNPIKYLPQKTVFYFDATVLLIEKVTSRHPVSNPVAFDHKKEILFFKHTEDTKKNTQFIIESIHKSSEVGIINIEDFENDMIIREHESYYAVSVISQFQESSYKIEKVSGRIYDIEHAHPEPSPLENDNTDIFIEIH